MDELLASISDAARPASGTTDAMNCLLKSLEPLMRGISPSAVGCPANRTNLDKSGMPGWQAILECFSQCCFIQDKSLFFGSIQGDRNLREWEGLGVRFA